MSLQEEVEVVDGSDAAVDDGASFRVALVVAVSGVGRVEASVMTFSLFTAQDCQISIGLKKWNGGNLRRSRWSR